MAQSLRIYLDNIKKQTRKVAANKRLSLIKTGSGPPDCAATDSVTELTLSLLNTNIQTIKLQLLVKTLPRK